MKNIFKGKIKLFVVMFAAAVIIAGCSGGSDNTQANDQVKMPEPVSTPAASSKLPEFSVYTLAGKEVKLTDKVLGNTPVILDIWATWCPPCVKEIPHFIELQEKYKGKFRFIGTSVDKSVKVVDDFVRNNHLNYDVYMASPSLEQYFQVRGIPTTIILDKNHNIINKVVGYRPKEFWESIIKNLISE